MCYLTYVQGSYNTYQELCKRLNLFNALLWWLIGPYLSGLNHWHYHTIVHVREPTNPHRTDDDITENQA